MGLTHPGTKHIWETGPEPSPGMLPTWLTPEFTNICMKKGGSEARSGIGSHLPFAEVGKVTPQEACPLPAVNGGLQGAPAAVSPPSRAADMLFTAEQLWLPLRAQRH